MCGYGQPCCEFHKPIKTRTSSIIFSNDNGALSKSTRNLFLQQCDMHCFSDSRAVLNSKDVFLKQEAVLLFNSILQDIDFVNT